MYFGGILVRSQSVKGLFHCLVTHLPVFVLQVLRMRPLFSLPGCVEELLVGCVLKELCRRASFGRVAQHGGTLAISTVARLL